MFASRLRSTFNVLRRLALPVIFMFFALPAFADTVTIAIQEHAVSTASSDVNGIAGGPDGNVWFTETNGNKIGRILSGSRTISEFALPIPNSSPTGITPGPDGAMWFTEYASNNVADQNCGLAPGISLQLESDCLDAFGAPA